MIVKRDLACLSAQGNRMPAGTYAIKSPPVGPITPVSATSSMNASSFSSSNSSSYNTYKSPTSISKASSISSSSPTNANGHGYSPGEVVIKEEDDEETILENQTQKEVDWEKKRAEKAAFERTFGQAIRETSGDNVEYLHTEPGQVMSPAERTETQGFIKPEI